MTRDYSEDALVEQPAIALFRESDRFQHVYDSCFGMGKIIYAATARARLAPGPRD